MSNNLITTKSIEGFITKWRADNSETVSKWIPEGAHNEPELIIGGLFPEWEYGAWRDPGVSIGMYSV